MLRAAIIGIAALCCGAAQGQIVAAEFGGPTTRYAHGVLGDAIEYGTLELRLKGGQGRRIVLPEARVFEDLAPRLADLDGDGAPEVIVVESDQNLGARLSVYGPDGLIAATPFIGRSNRWLAPIGAADLDGDGMVEIAYIDRPHLAKLLRVWRFQNGMLELVAEAEGLTNHQIGQDFISGGIRDCGQGPELITANANWSQIVATRLEEGRLTTRPLASYAGPRSFAPVLACGE
ncbi:FG-GAP repeat domain-containing protein [Actibacterium lipolyticum]|uniref:VCBS repeat-containing protein n=1 Tax=Actibacterium lipolyticum TaxID=1524263 RepID=A0A238KMK3_9RHOB|nr:VCBS repeat-containing protein [Actibacterium lipolyticum]SMX43382.1 hypothetical protein COL8621_02287 [Actibacterium lipolyticum]